MEYARELRNRDGDGGPEKPGPPRINCFRCLYFQVTWDPQFPKACKVFGFKGKELPSVTVLRTTGKVCPVFTPKQGSRDRTDKPHIPEDLLDDES